MASREMVTNLVEFMRDDLYGPKLFYPSERAIAFWCQQLADVPDAALMPALLQWDAAGNEYPPRPGQLKQVILGVARLDVPTWDEAWEEVMRAIGKIGSWGTPTWSHPAIERAVMNMGGWRVMCGTEVEQTPTVRAQFRMVYQSLIGRAEERVNTLPALREAAAAVDRLSDPRPVSAIIAGLLERRGAA